MRALIVSLALAVAVVICMTFVVLFAGLNVSSAILAIIGLGIFMVGSLFAAIAALGPKSRPTPLLTPTIAGSTAAALTTVALIVGTTHLGNAHRSTMRAGEPARVAAPAPNATEPAPEAVMPAPENSEPEPIRFPGMAIVPAEPQPAPVPALPDASFPAPTMTAPPMAEPAPPAPQTEVVDAAAEDAAGNVPQEAVTAPSLSPVPSTTTPIPIPPIPPPPTARLVLSEEPFDTSRPPPPPGGQTVAPPSTAGRTSANPPLPRSRPCGAGGLPCP